MNPNFPQTNLIPQDAFFLFPLNEDEGSNPSSSLIDDPANDISKKIRYVFKKLLSKHFSGEAHCFNRTIEEANLVKTEINFYGLNARTEHIKPCYYSTQPNPLSILSCPEGTNCPGSNLAKLVVRIDDNKPFKTLLGLPLENDTSSFETNSLLSEPLPLPRRNLVTSAKIKTPIDIGDEYENLANISTSKTLALKGVNQKEVNFHLIKLQNYTNYPKLKEMVDGGKVPAKALEILQEVLYRGVVNPLKLEQCDPTLFHDLFAFAGVIECELLLDCLSLYQLQKNLKQPKSSDSSMFESRIAHNHTSQILNDDYDAYLRGQECDIQLISGTQNVSAHFFKLSKLPYFSKILSFARDNGKSLPEKIQLDLTVNLFPDNHPFKKTEIVQENADDKGKAEVLNDSDDGNVQENADDKGKAELLNDSDDCKMFQQEYSEESLKAFVAYCYGKTETIKNLSESQLIEFVYLGSFMMDETFTMMSISELEKRLDKKNCKDVEKTENTIAMLLQAAYYLENEKLLNLAFKAARLLGKDHYMQLLIHLRDDEKLNRTFSHLPSPAQALISFFNP